MKCFVNLGSWMSVVCEICFFYSWFLWTSLQMYGAGVH